MNYITKNLLQNEKIVYATRPHWIVFARGFWTLIGAYIFWAYLPQFVSFLNFPVYNQWTTFDIGGIVLMLWGILLLIRAYIYYVTSEYGVTNKRVLIKVGWIERTSLELLVEKVEGVLVDQSVMGRILNYGAITIIGTGGTKDQFPFIPNPLNFRKTVQQQIDDIEERAHS